MISNSLSPQTRLTFSDSPFRSLDLPHNLGIISLPFSSRCLCSETHLLSVKIQGFLVGNCGSEAWWWFGNYGHDLVGFVGLIWWVLVVPWRRFWWGWDWGGGFWLGLKTGWVGGSGFWWGLRTVFFLYIFFLVAASG